MLAELVEALVLGAAHQRRDNVEWALAAARAACEGRGPIDLEAALVGDEVVVTASVRHLGRLRRNWAQARVKAWDGHEDHDSFVRRAMGEVVTRLITALDRREHV